jgi:hypothetical protein
MVWQVISSSFGASCNFAGVTASLSKAEEVPRTRPYATHSKSPRLIRWAWKPCLNDSSAKAGEGPDIDLVRPSEDKLEPAIYRIYARIDKAHEEETEAIADAVSFMFENPNPSQLSPAQIDKEIDLTN